MTDPTPDTREPVSRSGRFKQVGLIVLALLGVLFLAEACEEVLDDVFDLHVPVPHIHWR